MKACIVTFQSAYNFGAVIQAYALCNYLNENYCDAVILDYHNKMIDNTYKIASPAEFKRNPKGAAAKTVQYFLNTGKRRKTDRFQQKLRLTKRYDEGDTRGAADEADVFIAGSDQIWNYQLVGRDMTYFLDFAEGKTRCSYAASFGINEIPEEYESFYRQGMSYLDYISVRENNAVALAESLCKKKCSVLPDPTLLLDCERWSAVSRDPEEKNPYILVYKITREEKLLSFAKKLSKLTGLPVIYIPNDLKSGVLGKTKLSAGPDEWLGYIKNAEYVVTNSFHGTVFSIIFGKKFFTEVSATANTATSRSYSLLKMFDMENRIISNYKPEMLKEELPAKKISGVIKEQRENAKNYFDKVFGGAS